MMQKMASDVHPMTPERKARLEEAAKHPDEADCLRAQEAFKGFAEPMSGPANQLLRQLGLLLFLAEVGTSAGKNLVATFQESGLLMFGVGAAITVVPMLVAVIVGRLVFKINILDLLGTITGGMTSTPGLAAADSMVDSNIPSVAYATVYPIAMVFLILFIQVISSAVY